MMRFTPTASGAKVGVHFSEAVDAKRLARFIGKHRETAFVELHTERVDWLDAGEAAVVMHRAQDGYLAVADDAAEPRARTLLVEEADELIAILEGSFPEAATIVQPCVQMAAELKLNPPEFPDAYPPEFPDCTGRGRGRPPTPGGSGGRRRAR